MSRPVIISCAVTGSGDTTGQSRFVPVTPEQIADDALAAHAAGAAVVHLHVRNPAAGWSINIPQWIPAPKKSTPVDMVAVDRVVDVLSRFVATWVSQSREMRRVARIREAGYKFSRYMDLVLMQKFLS